MYGIKRSLRVPLLLCVSVLKRDCDEGKFFQDRERIGGFTYQYWSGTIRCLDKEM